MASELRRNISKRPCSSFVRNKEESISEKPTLLRRM
jgi:hypothetical protein